MKNKGKMDHMDWQWLKDQPKVDKKNGKFIKHVRLAKPFILKCDGQKSESVLFQEDDDTCKNVCTIDDQEIWNQNTIMKGEC